MGFVPVSIADEIEKKKANSPEFRKAWELTGDEYRLIAEVINLRRKQGDNTN